MKSFGIVCLLVAGAFAQNGNEISAVGAPVRATDVNHVYFAAVVALNLPELTSQTPKINGGKNGGSDTLNIDTESGTGVCTPVFSNWAAIDAVVASYKTNFIVQGASEGNTATTPPACVWSQAQANASAMTYGAGGSKYLNGDYVLQSGNFWQIQSTTWTSGYDNSCTIAGGANFTVAGPIADGTCTWTKVGPNAPVQDGYLGAGHTGNGCNVNNPGNGNYNINNLQGCTLSQMYDAQPIPELPYWNWYQKIIAALIAHYNSSPRLSNIGYFRFGYPMGGEYGGLGVLTWPYNNPASTGQTKAQFISWISRVDAYIMAQSPAMHILSDINCGSDVGPKACDYADQEAILANAYGMWGIGNEDAREDDMYNLTGVGSANCVFPLQSALAATTACTQGNWAYNCALFSNLHCELQYLNGSTPIDCLPGVVGPLAPLPVGSTFCPQGSIGYLPFLVQLCNTGVGSPNVKVCVKHFEMPIVVATCSVNCPQAQIASDVLLALSPTYSSTIGYLAQFAPYQTPYFQAFATYLGLLSTPPSAPVLWID